MKKIIIRLTESDLHRLVKESVKNIIMEYENSPYDNLMQRSMDNGGPDQVWEQYLSQKNTYYGKIAKMALQNNHRYTDVLNDLQKKINEYNHEGRFGREKEVLDTIGKFCSLLAYLNGAYESAISRLRNNSQLGESLLREWDNPLAGMTYKDTNRYGVKQKIGKDRRGQWMRDLQNELRQLLEWDYLHGPKTIAATEAFIEFLEVEKRGFGYFGPLKKMAKALAAVALLANVLNVYAPGVPGSPSPQQPQQQIQVQQAQQSLNVPFQVDSADLSPQMIQLLQQMGQNGGTFQVIVHESQNSSGMDASYEGQLTQMRANAIQQALGQNAQISFTRGTNSSTPYAEVIPGN